MRVTVIGSGAWGTTLAGVALDTGGDVTGDGARIDAPGGQRAPARQQHAARGPQHGHFGLDCQPAQRIEGCVGRAGRGHGGRGLRGPAVLPGPLSPRGVPITRTPALRNSALASLNARASSVHPLVNAFG